jgi:Cu-Zn family superoxide dismutase
VRKARTIAVLFSSVFFAACAAEVRTGSQASEPAPPQPVPQEPAPAVAPPAVTALDPGAVNPRRVREAVAVLSPTRGNAVTGTVYFRETPDGVDVFATVDNLPGNLHAYHVHVQGDCSAPDASSAGPHFNFTGSSFDRRVGFITGNLGELRPAGRDTATGRRHVPSATLQGKYSIIGRSVVVHARGNDPSVTPDGNTGARLACGVIGIAEPAR